MSLKMGRICCVFTRKSANGGGDLFEVVTVCSILLFPKLYRHLIELPGDLLAAFLGRAIYTVSGKGRRDRAYLLLPQHLPPFDPSLLSFSPSSSLSHSYTPFLPFRISCPVMLSHHTCCYFPHLVHLLLFLAPITLIHFFALPSLLLTTASHL